MNRLKQFIEEIKDYGFKVAKNNLLIDITMRIVNAREFKITYNE